MATSKIIYLKKEKEKIYISTLNTKKINIIKYYLTLNIILKKKKVLNH